MKFVYKHPFTGNVFRFERSGFFGTGNMVTIYKNGEYLDKLPIEEITHGYVGDSLKDPEFFGIMCEGWASGYE